MKHAYLLYTGYGKTKLCLDKIMSASKKPRTLLISTKNIVESSWPAEIEKWYPNDLTYKYIIGKTKPKERVEIVNSSYDILGINTEMLNWFISTTCSIKRKAHLKNGIKYYYNTDEILNRFDLIIFDEVSLFKNSQSERFKIIKNWAHRASNVLALSATPTPKNIENIWSIIYLLDGGQRLGKTITEFRTNYAITIPLSNGKNRYQYSSTAVDTVLDLIKDVTTSIPTPDQPLFPEPILKKYLIKTDEKTKQLLKKFKEDYILNLSNKQTLIAFSKNQLINKVSQIASGDVYYKNTVLNFNDLKLKALKNILNKIKTPVLILYHYVFDKDKLLEIPGARELSSAEDFKDWNKDKVPVGILSPYSAAHGLNLQDSSCEHIFWFSPIWDTERWIQTNARVCRRGQTKQITIGVFLLKESFDEYIFNQCQEKFRTQYNNLLKLK